MITENLFTRKVSFQTTARASLSAEMTIQEVLNDIHSIKYFPQIERLRTFIKNGQREEYTLYKIYLPAVTFCGTFEGERKKEFLKYYNQIMVIDIDKLDVLEFERVKKVLKEDKFVFAFWESPSKEGIKGLVSLSYEINIDSSNIDDCHKSAFRKLQKYFLETHNIELDKSGSDTTRLCFFSYDLNLIQKTNITSFLVNELNIEKVETKNKPVRKTSARSVSKLDALNNPQNKNDPKNRKTIQAIIKFLTKKNLSITYTYDEWYRVAFAIANTFTYEIGEKYFFNLCQIDKDKFNKTECENMLIYCFENRKDLISFKTIEFFATQKGYKKH